MPVLLDSLCTSILRKKTESVKIVNDFCKFVFVLVQWGKRYIRDDQVYYKCELF